MRAAVSSSGARSRCLDDLEGCALARTYGAVDGAVADGCRLRPRPVDAADGRAQDVAELAQDPGRPASHHAAARPFLVRPLVVEVVHRTVGARPEAAGVLGQDRAPALGGVEPAQLPGHGAEGEAHDDARTPRRR